MHRIVFRSSEKSSLAALCSPMPSDIAFMALFDSSYPSDNFPTLPLRPPLQDLRNLTTPAQPLQVHILKCVID